jgi:hypothetical protein
MGLVKDRDKWLEFIDEGEEPAVTPLAVSPELLYGGRFSAANPATRPQEKRAALVLTFRPVTGASEEVAADLLALLIRNLSYREGELGGDGLNFDAQGSTFAPARCVLQLVPRKAEGAAQRVARLVEELNAENQRDGERSEEEHGGIGARIVKNLKSTLPVSPLRLELAAVA